MRENALLGTVPEESPHNTFRLSVNLTFLNRTEHGRCLVLLEKASLLPYFLGPRVYVFLTTRLRNEYCTCAVRIRTGGAYLDEPPEHMVRDDLWLSEKSSEFGVHWEEARAVIRELEYRADIWLADVNNGNIKFAMARKS